MALQIIMQEKEMMAGKIGKEEGKLPPFEDNVKRRGQNRKHRHDCAITATTTATDAITATTITTVSLLPPLLLCH